MSDYLERAVLNLAYGLRQLKSPYDSSKPIFRQVLETPIPLSTVYPNVRMFPGGGENIAAQDVGYGQLRQTFTIVMRVYVAKADEGYDSTFFRVAWRIQPMIMNYINQHPDLVFTDTQAADLGVSYPDIDELDPDGVLCRQTSRLGLFRDTPEHIGMEFGVDLTFIVDNERTFYTGA